MIKELLRDGLKGKTIGRILFNNEVKKHCINISGDTIDLACGKNPSYYASLPSVRIVKADYILREGVDIVVNLNEKISLPDNSYDNALLFNAIYILKDRVATLREIRRILKPNGTLYLTSPFTNIETPEPDDYGRLTAQGLEEEFKKAGFKEIKISRYGERFASAANLLHPFMLFNAARVVVYSLSLAFDKFIPRSIKQNHPAPLGYFCIAKK